MLRGVEFERSLGHLLEPACAHSEQVDERSPSSLSGIIVDKTRGRTSTSSLSLKSGPSVIVLAWHCLRTCGMFPSAFWVKKRSEDLTGAKGLAIIVGGQFLRVLFSFSDGCGGTDLPTARRASCYFDFAAQPHVIFERMTNDRLQSDGQGSHSWLEPVRFFKMDTLIFVGLTHTGTHTHTATHTHVHRKNFHSRKDSEVHGAPVAAPHQRAAEGTFTRRLNVSEEFPPRPFFSKFSSYGYPQKAGVLSRCGRAALLTVQAYGTAVLFSSADTPPAAL